MTDRLYLATMRYPSGDYATVAISAPSLAFAQRQATAITYGRRGGRRTLTDCEPDVTVRRLGLSGNWTRLAPFVGLINWNRNPSDRLTALNDAQGKLREAVARLTVRYDGSQAFREHAESVIDRAQKARFAAEELERVARGTLTDDPTPVGVAEAVGAEA